MQAEAKTDKRSLATAIRRKCLDCSGGSKTEADRCQVKDCALYPYRHGNSQRRGDEQEEA